MELEKKLIRLEEQIKDISDGKASNEDLEMLKEEVESLKEKVVGTEKLNKKFEDLTKQISGLEKMYYDINTSQQLGAKDMENLQNDVTKINTVVLEIKELVTFNWLQMFKDIITKNIVTKLIFGVFIGIGSGTLVLWFWTLLQEVISK